METLFRRALDRGRAARYRKSEAFEAAVAAGLDEVLSQPFGSPLTTAQGHAANPWLSVEQRCAWTEVSERLTQGVADGTLQRFSVGPDPNAALSDPAAEAQPAPALPPVVRTFRTYVVGLRTDAGPTSPAGLLRTLAAGGSAAVDLGYEPSGEPYLRYTVDASLHPEALAPLAASTEEAGELRLQERSPALDHLLDAVG